MDDEKDHPLSDPGDLALDLPPSDGPLEDDSPKDGPPEDVDDTGDLVDPEGLDTAIGDAHHEEHAAPATDLDVTPAGDLVGDVTDWIDTDESAADDLDTGIENTDGALELEGDDEPEDGWTEDNDPMEDEHWVDDWFDEEDESTEPSDGGEAGLDDPLSEGELLDG